MRRILFVNKKKALHLIKQALLNSGEKDLLFPVEFSHLELDKELYQFLCEKIEEGFSALKKIKILNAWHHERYPYTGLINHLVFYKWWQEKEGNSVSLLQMWADLGCGLAKRTLFY